MAELRADLVLEGGGVKGIAIVGAIAVLEERGYTFNRVAGTSAGAIVGALVAAGYSGPELERVMRAVDYKRFRDGNFLDRFGLVGQALSVLFEQGVYRGEFLERWLGAQLAAKNATTFADLELRDPGSTLPAGQQYKLVVMTSDISDGVLRRLPWDYDSFGVNADSSPIVNAVRASMSIPFFYAPVKLENRAGQRRWFVDGGMLSNFPITVFDRTDDQAPRWPTFGIKLSARPEASQGVAHRIRGVLTLTRAMIATMTGFYDRMHIDDPSVQARTIFVDTMNVKSTDFDIDSATQQQLYDSGRRAAERFLDGGPGQARWDWEAYLAKYRPTGAGRVT
jgi:NTE family protein